MQHCEKLNLSGRVAVVTGSSAGIGAETALLLAKRGALVTIHGRRPEKLEEMSAEIEKVTGKKPFSVVGNIEDETVQEKLINGTIAHFGRLDILVSNAGYAISNTLENSNKNDLRSMLENHLIAPFGLCKLAFAELIKNKGNIIFMSSVAGQTGIPDFWTYSAAKAALDNMCRSLSGMLAGNGVRVNCISPGIVQTEIARDFGDIQKNLENLEAMKAVVPIGRIGKPSDIAEFVAFVASDAAAYMTGQMTIVDGGKLACCSVLS